jgi:hypothetical protein
MTGEGARIFTTTELSRVFLLERHNQHFLGNRTRWTSQERRSATRLGIVCAFCFCITLALLANHRDSVQLLSRGQKADAIIVDKRTDTDTDSRYVSYQFATNTAAALTRVEKRTNRAEFDGSILGNVVPVVYDERDPSHCLVGPQIASFRKDKAILAGWLMFSAILLICMIHYLQWHRSLRFEGIVIKGSLRSVKLHGGGAEDPDQVEVCYAFESPSGNRIEADSKGSAWRSNASQLSQSDPDFKGEKGVMVAVLYLSDKTYVLL